MLNPYNKMVVDWYADAYFAGLWGHGNNQDPICDGSRDVFVVTFSNFPLLWVPKIHTDISLFTTNSDYVSLYQSIRELLPLESLIK